MWDPSRVDLEFGLSFVHIVRLSLLDAATFSRPLMTYLSLFLVLVRKWRLHFAFLVVVSFSTTLPFVISLAFATSSCLPTGHSKGLRGSLLPFSTCPDFMRTLF